jgi:hypothetical protein
MEAFMLFFPLDKPDEVRSLLEKRQYVKGSEGDKLLFTWSRGAVVISSEARAKLYPASMVLTPPAQMPEVEAKPTLREKPVEVKPAAEEKPQEVRQPPIVARVTVTPPVLTEKVAEKAVETTASSAPPKKEEKDAEEEGPLLLAKSSYLQDGDETRKEAVRVSKVLRAFRWNVEPAYMIGVILDNNLSIETNTGVISRTLIKRIENLGYTLIAVNVSREKPTAWFKKKTVQPRAPGTDSGRFRELERRIDEQARMLDEERRHFDEERAGWQQRFTLLKRLMASMGEPAPTEEGGADLSEAEPEPDLSS